jgi:SAM-dependent methyltransferase
MITLSNLIFEIYFFLLRRDYIFYLFTYLLQFSKKITALSIINTIKYQTSLGFMSAPIGSSTAFWGKVTAVETEYTPEAPVILMGKTLASRAKDYRTEMFHYCSSPNPATLSFRRNPPQRVLDLGCGRGANTLAMIKKGSYVCGIDTDGDLLSEFFKKIRMEGCKPENARLRCADITKLETYREYGKTFDLVFAVDVLPYISPKDLRATMEKIRDCMSERAHLVGTIFITEDTDRATLEVGRQLGGHFYEGGMDFVISLLEACGFKIEQLESRGSCGISFTVIKI